MSIWAAVILAAFLVAWRMGYVLQIRNYVAETREELRKCAWPNWEELKGQTLLVGVSILLLGVFTAAVDFACTLLMRIFT
jgi:preprotein translocase SecE subunit